MTKDLAFSYLPGKSITQIKYVTEKLPAGDVSHIKAILTNVLFLSVLTV